MRRVFSRPRPWSIGSREEVHRDSLNAKICVALREVKIARQGNCIEKTESRFLRRRSGTVNYGTLLTT